jgi:hypothetical protein
MPRFVILEHAPGPASRAGRHWDLMLQQGQRLRTWALAAPPAPGLKIDAEELADHRLEYLDYEGPVSAERGTVSRWDGGEYRLLEEDAARLSVELVGQRGCTRLVLQRLAGEAQRWVAEFSPPDDAADPRCSVRPAR